MKRAVALLPLLLACAPPRVDFGETARRYGERDYDEVLQRWTRTSSLYRGLTSILFLSGTLKTWDFRQAYMARYITRYALSPAERESLLARERAAHESAHEVFLSFAPQVRRWSDLAPPASPWHLSLVNENGEEVHPLAVSRIRHLTPDVQEFFPYHGPFAEAYVVRFPRKLADGRPLLGPSPRKLVLRLAGAPGRTELVWVAGAAERAVTASRP